MSIAALLMAFVFLTTSCGIFKHAPERKVASLENVETKHLSYELDEKILSLHIYNLLAYRYLEVFDSELQLKTLEKLYQSQAYLSLMAIRTQVDEIEAQIEEYFELNQKEFLKDKILAFSKESKLTNLSMRKIIEKFELEEVGQDIQEINSEYLMAEIKKYEVLKEFQVYEKNIEHLSHLMIVQHKDQGRKFFPGNAKSGNLSGREFPSKVWALTFDDGPDKNRSPKILALLASKNLKATFFPLSKKVLENPKLAKTFLTQGMEIGGHSYSHKMLTTVGSLTLDKEITDSTQSMEKALKVELQFFRLPYAVGISAPLVRQKIAQNELIHVSYNVDSLDWILQRPDKIIQRTKMLMKKSSRDSGIILFHDTHGSSVKASAAIMDYLKKEGRRACTVGEIVKDMNEGVETVCSKL